MSQLPATTNSMCEPMMSPDIASIIEMARQHFSQVHGYEPGPNDNVFDLEPPSDQWQQIFVATPTEENGQ